LALTDEGLLPILESCHQLRKLDLHGCRELSDLSLQNIPELIEIEWLSIEHCRRFSSMAISSLSRLRKLTCLYFNGCGYSVDDDALLPILRANPFLNQLYLHTCSLITDVSLQAMGTFSRNLKILQLPQGSVRYSNNGIMSLNSDFAQLTVAGLDNETLISLAGKSPSLRSLFLTSCRSIGDEGCIYLASSCPLLECIELPFADLTNKGLQALSVGCGKLKYLEISCCPNVTELSIASTLEAHPTLHFIITGVPNIQAEDLARRFPLAEFDPCKEEDDEEFS